MPDLFDHIGLINVCQDLIRNIPSLRVSADLFDDLSPDPADQAVAVAHEMRVKPPFYTTHQPSIRRPFEEAHWFDVIQFPFDHWTRSRYSNGRFGVWYGADSLVTSVHETLYHWHRFLDDAGYPLCGAWVQRRIYAVHCRAALLDLRPALDSHPALIHPTCYALSQALGQRVHEEGHPGLVNRSARCAGLVYAVLNPGVLSRPRARCHLDYRGTETGVLVERAPGEVILRIDAVDPNGNGSADPALHTH